MLRALFVMLVIAAAGCGIPAQAPIPSGLHSPFTGYQSRTYGNDKMWLCRPDLPNSPCHGDQTATELHPDGSRTVVPHVPAPHPDVDCFYVYPTVDLGIFPGNHTDFSDLGPMTKAAMNQIARFDEVCAVYVPLYRQITIGTYFWGARERRLDVAFSDVADAFLEYMAHYNHGRKVVLVGHSQGAEMVVRLLHRFFDDDPALRAQLLVALPIGGPFELPHGQVAGGSLTNVPACTSSDELGCAIGYHSYVASGKPLDGWLWDDPLLEESACVNPAGFGPGYHRFARSYFPVEKLGGRSLQGVDGIKTPFVLVRDRYWGACVKEAGKSYLVVAAAPAANGWRGPIDMGDAVLHMAWGLHILDMHFPLGDLIDLVGHKAQVAREAPKATP